MCAAPTDGPSLDVWIGLFGVGNNPTVFTWMDQAPVTFTYWGPNQPVGFAQGNICVFYSGQV